MKYLASIAVLLAMCGLAIPASAQDGEPTDDSSDVFTFGSEPGWHLMGGLQGGGSFGSPGGGGFAGLELSMSRLHRSAWWGAYLDASYDFGQGAALATLGPEVGYGLFGLDGGVAAHLTATGADAGTIDVGPQARVLITAGFFGLFGRYIYLLDAESHIGQAGILFKLPLWAD